ncbi:hypothetical protein TELCIR_24326 [Teladorsagia circumcincta]|uniref:Uncharacterized protein n=1 Tax=Teladorsagia circumcincta TaxID=45464 RepID=A0A2G9T8Q7_TELCI|nr:hypothetical protein TELCIR_24326 [Teladorsagia circumcincta]
MAHIKPWLEIFTGLSLVVDRKVTTFLP